RELFGFAILVDCHSMPSSSMTRPGGGRPDIVLGDRYGTSCASELTELVAQSLTRLGYSVSRNKPYAGGFITEHYGQPSRSLHAMQIEVNRCLYMDERSLQKTAGFPRLLGDLGRLFGELARAFDAGMLTRAEAAE
ncbi:MAG: N-formylglutamate amidohydrolase, partial [Methylocella sp.]